MLLMSVCFFSLSIAVFAGMLFALRPSSAEQSLQVRIADIRNPRRSPHAESDDVLLDGQARGGMGRQLGSYLEHWSMTARLDRLLLEADSPILAGSLVLTSLAGGVLAAMAGLATFHSVPLTLAGMAAGCLLPFIKLRHKRKKRLRAVIAGLPDAAEMMSRALRSGHSMTQTIELAAEQAAAPLGAEFGRVFQQQKLGVPLRDVLVELGRRIPSRDLQFLITAILVQRETGGDLAAVLDRTAAVLRERIQLQAQVQIHTAQGRMTGWILSAMPVVLLGAMVVFSPDYAHGLFVDPLGRKLLYAGAGLIVTGGLIIRRIVAVEV